MQVVKSLNGPHHEKDQKEVVPKRGSKPPRTTGPNVSRADKDIARVEARKNRAEALKLRLEGHSFTEIAEKLKCSPKTAFLRVRKATRDIDREEAQEVRTQELMRLQMIWKQAWPFILAGSDKHMAIGLKCIHAVVTLLGLAPALKLEATVAAMSGATPAQVGEVMRAAFGRALTGQAITSASLNAPTDDTTNPTDAASDGPACEPSPPGGPNPLP